MSDDKSRGDKASDIAKNIWLAGLGAYGKAFNEARDKLDTAALEPPKLFRDLVEKGMRLEDDVRDSITNIRKTGASSVEERINRVRESFPLSRGDDLNVLNAKMDALIERVDQLATIVENGLSTSAPAPRKTTTKKATVAKKKATAKGKTTRQKKPATTKSATKTAASKPKIAARKKAAAAKNKAPAGRSASRKR